MNFIDKIVFPKPKFKSNHEFEKNLVYIPLFKDFCMYKKLKKYLMDMRVAKLSIKSTTNLNFYDTNDRPREKVLNEIDSVCTNDVSFSFVQSEKESNPKEALDKKNSNENQSSPLNLHTQIDLLNIKTSRTTYKTKIFDTDTNYSVENHKRNSFLKRNQTMDFFTAYNRVNQSVKSFENCTLETEINSSHKELENKIFDYLPCTYYEYSTTADLLIYFHSNAEDLTMLESMCLLIKQSMKINVLAMEYAGYSVYHNKHTKSDRIKFDCLSLIYFLRDSLGINTKNMILTGRSMGSGPAIFLSNYFDFKMITIVSGFLSIKKVAQDKFSFLGYFVDHYFNNEEAVTKNQSPLLIIHGKNDEIIKSSHAETLYELATSKSKIVLFDDMSHNSFHFYDCVLNPLKDYLKKLNSRTKIIPSNENIQDIFKDIFSKKIFKIEE
jgi:fermentation-respiration switch protein FrsA (DUF1100 family)